jgi:transcription factor IIIB subunit 2
MTACHDCPLGICGAALFIAAHIHGCECSKRDIMAVVHVGWQTVEKRVMEFAHSHAGELTLREFEQLAGQMGQERVRGR